eukprot:6237713-Ditylum_brightwellii.AAC.1
MAPAAVSDFWWLWLQINGVSFLVMGYLAVAAAIKLWSVSDMRLNEILVCCTKLGLKAPATCLQLATWR